MSTVFTTCKLALCIPKPVCVYSAVLPCPTWRTRWRIAVTIQSSQCGVCVCDDSRTNDWFSQLHFNKFVTNTNVHWTTNSWCTSCSTSYKLTWIVLSFTHRDLSCVSCEGFSSSRCLSSDLLPSVSKTLTHFF